MIETLTLKKFLDESQHGVVIDVRTPAEFEAGHIHGAINIPLFTNEERVVVGTIYKKIGKDQAIEKGLEFVGPKMANFVREAKRQSAGRKLLLYCWRGGMRSGSMAWLFATAGLPTAVLRGGYKTYRRGFEILLKDNWRFIIMTGMTGSGKTELLQIMSQLGEQILDLEGLAHHKGSVFGGMGQLAQPTTEEFINKIHHCLRGFDPTRPVWCEGESMLIGHVCIPPELFGKLQASDYVVVELDTESRIKRLVGEYGDFDLAAMTEAFTKISKRLGTDNAKVAIEMLQSGDIAGATRIALKYYDKGYSNSTAQRTGKQLLKYEINPENLEQSAKELILKI